LTDAAKEGTEGWLAGGRRWERERRGRGEVEIASERIMGEAGKVSGRAQVEVSSGE
jgi:hypothetical protein